MPSFSSRWIPCYHFRKCVATNFQEYIGFVKCMNAMKGMKLCYKDRDSEKAWTSNIKVGWNWWIVPSAKCDISVSRLLLIFEGRGIGCKKNGIGKVSAMILEILLYRYKGSLHICTSIEKFVIVKTLVTNGLVTDTVSMATSIQTKYCQ